MPQAMTTRSNARRFGVALHLPFDGFDDRAVGRVWVPKHRAFGPVTRMLGHALMETLHHIRGHIYAAILRPLPCSICKALGRDRARG